jgi:hypothetical protein
MKLFLVKRTDHIGYDEYSDFVVAAENLDAALLIHPDDESNWKDGHWWTGKYKDDTWADPTTLIVTEIGTVNDGITGVICASYHAG